VAVKIYVINLDRRLDRLERISKQLTESNLSFERIQAVDAKSLEAFATNVVLEKTYVANWMSHQIALGVMSNSKEEFGLILEDDADLKSSEISPDELASLTVLMKSNEIDLLQIGYISEIYKLPRLRGFLELILDIRGRRLSWQHTSKKWLVKNRYRAGSHCYMISRSAASKLFGLNVPPALATDPFYAALAENSVGIQIARLGKSLVEQESRNGSLNPVDSDLS
jgi:GR25 family glycosyltransferase involved in LPS biosynthesis